MTFDMLLTLGALLLLLTGVIAFRAPLDIAMVGTLTLLMLAGVVTPADAFEGFGNPAVVMIAALYVIARGMRDTGVIDRWAPKLLGRPTSTRQAIASLSAPVAGLSAIMNNTPLVAMFMPATIDLSRKMKISPSKLLMPLSFACILGGQLTLVGTASNLIVDGMYSDWLAAEHASGVLIPATWVLEGSTRFFAPAAAGLAAVVLGLLYMIVMGPKLLADRAPARVGSADEGAYKARFTVSPDGVLVGKTIEQAGLRSLPGLFLSSIERGSRMIAAVSREEVLQGDDRLGFVGDAEGVRDLRRIAGLHPTSTQPNKVETITTLRRLIEAVVAPTAPFTGQTVRESRFRTTYNAAIIAIRRQGEPVDGRIGDIVLRAGDVLLLETHAGFIEAHGRSQSFHFASAVKGSQPVRHDRAILAVGVLVAMVVGFVTGVLSPVVVAWTAALAMVLLRCTSTSRARRSIDFSVLVSIGAAIGVGGAIASSGLGAAISETLLAAVSAAGGGPHLALGGLILATMAVSSLATNYGGATILFPIAMSTAMGLGTSPVPFMLGVVAGAGSNFLTPITYQTNLMVLGPGRYRFTDFTRFGLGLQLIVLTTATALIPLVFPF
jgi:di/tricarboxylate transporter